MSHYGLFGDAISDEEWAAREAARVAREPLSVGTGIAGSSKVGRRVRRVLEDTRTPAERAKANREAYKKELYEATYTEKLEHKKHGKLTVAGCFRACEPCAWKKIEWMCRHSNNEPIGAKGRDYCKGGKMPWGREVVLYRCQECGRSVAPPDSSWSWNACENHPDAALVKWGWDDEVALRRWRAGEIEEPTVNERVIGVLWKAWSK